MSNKKITWPNGKKFAFTIVDDTDLATLENIKPIYDYLYTIGILTTKTIWVFNQSENIYRDSDTLERKEYLDYIISLKNKGFEIASHGVRGTSSKRNIIMEGFEEFKNRIGSYPNIHINHAQNEDNLYWGYHRLFKLQKLLHKMKIKTYSLRGIGYGGQKDSDYFWGDFAQKHIKYVRGNTFKEINVFAKDPFTPYFEARFPYVNAWFSSANGASAKEFIDLLSVENQNKLEEEGGLCIVYTHFGTKGFLNADGELDGNMKFLLDNLAKKDGWFVPANEILDYIVSQRGISKVDSLRQWLRQK
jgi:hypothetical protein